MNTFCPNEQTPRYFSGPGLRTAFTVHIVSYSFAKQSDRHAFMTQSVSHSSRQHQQAIPKKQEAIILVGLSAQCFPRLSISTWTIMIPSCSKLFPLCIMQVLLPAQGSSAKGENPKTNKAKAKGQHQDAHIKLNMSVKLMCLPENQLPWQLRAGGGLYHMTGMNGNPLPLRTDASARNISRSQ